MSRSTPYLRRQVMAILFGPSLLLAGPLAFYQYYGGTLHFLLHTLMGWDVGLIVLLIATLRNARVRLWEGCVPVGLAAWAMLPDVIYAAGPYHHDWMDVFLFHISLDAIWPYALAVETLVWLVLLLGYRAYRAAPARPYHFSTGGARRRPSL